MVETNARSRRISVLIVLNLVQDIETIKPLIRSLSDDLRVDLRITLPGWLQKKSARVVDFLNSIEQRFTVFNRIKILTDYRITLLDDIDYLLLPSESNLRPHIIPHHLAKVAKRRGIRTITFQHGIENIGLTYFDQRRVKIASDVVITWNDSVQKDSRIDPSIAEKCLTLGMFKEVELGISTSELRSLMDSPRIIGVFENLHWDRYSKDYRMNFLNSLEFTASINKDICFLVKPHHVGRWMNSRKNQLSDNSGNIRIIDPKDPFWERFTGNQLVGACDSIITTPSTIAIDATLSNTSVAIVANDLHELRYFEPLTFLRNREDWNNYIQKAYSNSETLFGDSMVFKELTVISHNPVSAFLEKVLNIY